MGHESSLLFIFKKEQDMTKVFNKLVDLKRDKLEIFGVAPVDVWRKITPDTNNISQGIRFFGQSIIDLGYAANSDDHKRLSKLYSQAVNFRSNKKMVKTFLGNLFLTPTILFMALLPFGIPYLFFEYRLEFSGYLLTYIVTLVCAILLVVIMSNLLDFVDNFNVKIGKALTKMLQAMIVGSFCALSLFVIPMEEGIFKASFLAIYGVTTLILAYSIFEYIVSEVSVDAKSHF